MLCCVVLFVLFICIKKESGLLALGNYCLPGIVSVLVRVYCTSGIHSVHVPVVFLVITCVGAFLFQNSNLPDLAEA